MSKPEPKTFHVESVEISTPVEVAFAYISDVQNLPAWTHAFKEVGRGKALMETPAGSIEVGIEVIASRQFGTIDWFMTMPDGTVAAAFSRVTPLGKERTAYSFMLLAPPVPLEQVEGSLNQQVVTLRQELAKLTDILGAKSHVG
jgi:hypothetical protein